MTTWTRDALETLRLEAETRRKRLLSIANDMKECLEFIDKLREEPPYDEEAIDLTLETLTSLTAGLLRIVEG